MGQVWIDLILVTHGHGAATPRARLGEKKRLLQDLLAPECINDLLYTLTKNIFLLHMLARTFSLISYCLYFYGLLQSFKKSLCSHTKLQITEQSHIFLFLHFPIFLFFTCLGNMGTWEYQCISMFKGFDEACIKFKSSLKRRESLYQRQEKTIAQFYSSEG